MTSNVFDLLRAELDAPYEIGSWFLINNSMIIQEKSNKPFSSKSGMHPVVIGTRYNPGRHGPNVSGYPRSTSCPGDFRHLAHSNHDGDIDCAINKDGWVKTLVPVSISVSEVSGESYSCCEGADSKLLLTLGNLK